MVRGSLPYTFDSHGYKQCSRALFIDVHNTRACYGTRATAPLTEVFWITSNAREFNERYYWGSLAVNAKVILAPTVKRKLTSSKHLYTRSNNHTVRNNSASNTLELVNLK